MLTLSSYVAGKPVQSTQTITVRNPYNNEITGTVATANRADTDAAVAAARGFKETPSRYQRSMILEGARQRLEARREEFARSIASEAGLALREGRYEVGRALDVLRFASIEALRDDGQVFSCDVSAQGKARKIFTLREPLSCCLLYTSPSPRD